MSSINYYGFSNHATNSVWDNLISSEELNGFFEGLVDMNDLQALALEVQTYTEYSIEEDFETTNTNPSRYLAYSLALDMLVDVRWIEIAARLSSITNQAPTRGNSFSGSYMGHPFH